VKFPLTCACRSSLSCSTLRQARVCLLRERPGDISAASHRNFLAKPQSAHRNNRPEVTPRPY